MDLTEDEKVTDFFLDREISATTEENYIRHLKYFIESQDDNLTPAELIKEAKDEELAGIYEDYRKIEKRFKKFKIWLLQQKMEDKSKKGVLISIKTFYRVSKVRWIPDTTIKVKRKKQVKLKQLPNREEIKTALMDSSLKYQAIILLAASSGLHRGDIRSLKLTDLLESFNDQAGTYFNGITDIEQMIQIAESKEIVLKWESDRYKNDIEFMTFSSPETTKAICKYLKSDPPKNSNDYLFRVKEKKIIPDSFKSYFRDLNNRLGNINKYKRIHPRNLRSRFGSLLMKNGVNYRQAEYMLGHVLPPVQGSYYFLLDEESMRLAYFQALPSLTVLEDVETRVLTDERLIEYEKRDKQKDELIHDMMMRLDALERGKDRKDRLKKIK